MGDHLDLPAGRFVPQDSIRGKRTVTSPKPRIVNDGFIYSIVGLNGLVNLPTGLNRGEHEAEDRRGLTSKSK